MEGKKVYKCDICGKTLNDKDEILYIDRDRYIHKKCWKDFISLHHVYYEEKHYDLYCDNCDKKIEAGSYYIYLDNWSCIHTNCFDDYVYKRHDVKKCSLKQLIKEIEGEND